jgi:type IV secretion system protein VirB3
MAEIISNETIAGLEAPVHRALIDPILLGGVPRNIAIVNGTLSAAFILGLHMWITGIVMWVICQVAAVWATKRDPSFVDVVRRHIRYPSHFGS